MAMAMVKTAPKRRPWHNPHRAANPQNKHKRQYLGGTAPKTGQRPEPPKPKHHQIMRTPKNPQLASLLGLVKEKAIIGKEIQRLTKTLAAVEEKILEGMLVALDRPQPQEPTPAKSAQAQAPKETKPKLGDAILAALHKNPEGVKVVDLASALNRKPSHIFVWWCNIGKKIAGLSASKGVLVFKPEPQNQPPPKEKTAG